ncbi:hypothetical protein [Herbidospora yilanensis]|uniref:hypothetical protein n=1 Tax=Herbidospora yilanensis TaxID=354426 RepID=UPI0007804262|nr:hypothetical protein [Herbidospora yilanensis]
MPTESEAHYTDLSKIGEFGDLTITWCRAVSADSVIGAIGGAVFDVSSNDLGGLIIESVKDLMDGRLPRFILLAEESPWFLLVEYSRSRTLEALELLSDDEAICLTANEFLVRGDLHYARGGVRLCTFVYGGDVRGDTAAIEDHLDGLFNLHERYADIDKGLVPGEQFLDDWRVHALILMERITGIRLSAELLNRESALYRFREWDDPPQGGNIGN